MPGLQTNSLDKIVKVYFAGVCSKPFEYAGETFRPKEIHVSPHIFRGSTCPMSCGGCCFKFSLVWMETGEPHPYQDLPEEAHLPEGVQWEEVEVNGVRRYILVDSQPNNTGHFCHHVNKTNGRCGIHGVHPFTCDFELIRFTHQESRCDIATRGFGRGWSYTRITGQEGALCDLLPPSEAHRDDAHRKLVRLKAWADYFSLPTHLDRILEYVRTGPHNEPLSIKPGARSLLDLINR